MPNNPPRPVHSAYNISFFRQLARKAIRVSFRMIFQSLARVEITGLENVPKSGAYLIAVNHVSLFEPPLMLAFWPVAPEAIGAVDIWSRPGQSTLARLYGGIPAHRGEYDRNLIETTLAVLKSGRPLLIAPEGTRSHKPGMQRARPGTAFIIEKYNVPVVPVGLVGTTDDFLKLALKGKRPILEMRIGKPVILAPIEGQGETKRLARQRNVDQIMLHIAALLPLEYRGVYADASLYAYGTPGSEYKTAGI